MNVRSDRQEHIGVWIMVTADHLEQVQRKLEEGYQFLVERVRGLRQQAAHHNSRELPADVPMGDRQSMRCNACSGLGQGLALDVCIWDEAKEAVPGESWSFPSSAIFEPRVAC